LEVDILESLPSDRTLCLPVILKREEPLAFKRYHHGDELRPSEIFKKLMEPLSYATSIEPDIVIVPMLGFDNKLRRIGYGGGFYDRTLAGNRAAFVYCQ
jgi:5-formyltetrahydrofolate cyclo-ligase